MNRNSVILSFKAHDGIHCTACVGILNEKILNENHCGSHTSSNCNYANRTGNDYYAPRQVIYGRDNKKYNNTIHQIVADINKCNGRDFGCSKDCIDCRITKAIEFVQKDRSLLNNR